MAWADMAIAAGGTTAWELAFMQLPALLLVLADNQEGVAAGIDHFGAARSLGRGDRLDEATIAAEVKKKAADVALLRRMAAQGRRLVDGLGVERILSAMAEREAFFSTANFYLRPATPDDCLLLWQWANDPVVRRSSFHTQAIDWTEHEAWYVEKLASPDCRIWIMHIGALPVGQIRYERIGGDAAEISFSIARGFRGKQLGTRLLEASGEQALRELGVRWLQGAVRIDNEASCRAFLKAGFDRTKQEGRDGTPHWLFRRAAHVNGWLEDYVAVH
jgi:RimJ/RimL family protein N-acetyltransferase